LWVTWIVGYSLFSVDSLHFLSHFFLGRHVESAYRLVQEQNFRIHYEPPGQRGFLPLPATQSFRITIGQMLDVQKLRRSTRFFDDSVF